MKGALGRTEKPSRSQPPKSCSRTRALWKQAQAPLAAVRTQVPAPQSPWRHLSSGPEHFHKALDPWAASGGRGRSLDTAGLAAESRLCPWAGAGAGAGVAWPALLWGCSGRVPPGDPEPPLVPATLLRGRNREGQDGGAGPATQSPQPRDVTVPGACATRGGSPPRASLL